MASLTDPLLEPFELKHLVLRNRIMSTSHAPAFQEGGHPRDRYRLYHEEKARGGIGLTMVGGSTNIALDSPSVFGQLYAGDDNIIPWFQKLTDGVRSHGAAVMCQITHMGRRTSWDDGHWLPVIDPSGLRERAHRSFPAPMQLEDIERVVEQFANAALRCKKGGFDGIELLSHSHLLGQFLSPLVNQRDDEFGGSLDNRMRMLLMVIDAVRNTVGKDFIVGVRATGDELVAGGLTSDDCVLIAKTLAATNKVDFLNVLAGAPYDDLGLAGWVPPMGMPSAAHLTIAGRIRKSVDIPVFHAGGVADIATARHAVAEGHVDVIGMTRAHIADPYLVAKLQRQEEHRIRPCVGLGYCVDRVNQGKDAVCGHNAASGREATIPHIIPVARTVKKVVVVGGGPAGLEAARISAQRGHEVVLFEASDRLGGQINLAGKSVTRRQITGVADWLIQEVSLLNVDVHLNRFAEARDVVALNPDYVVVACGGWPMESSYAVPGSELIISAWEVLSGEARVSGEVILCDEIGDHAGAVCADVMSRQGCKVTIVTPDRALLHELGPTNSSVVLRDLATLKIKFECLQELASIEQAGNRKKVTLRHVLTGEKETRIVDNIVMEHGAKPMDAIFHELKDLSCNGGQLNHEAIVAGQFPFINHRQDSGFYLARIGDAVASRNIHAALYDAIRVCKDM